ncbi:MAG TPA: TetR/AcrR family transcriptional regulator [Candidatus Aminicenantes bacterium]|nr:TetR/AcrR family transcriptional regulator [Candidatus Aminicenantes bacterium]
MGIHERKQREYDRRRDQILESARRLFQARGFQGVTLDDIALDIEFSKGTIYSHFTSKEEIVAQILLEHLHHLLEALRQVDATSTDTEDGFRRALEAYLAFYDQHRDYSQLLFFVDMVSNRYRIPKDLLNDIHRQKVNCLSELQSILKKSAGPVPAGGSHDFKHLALLLWGMLNGILQLVGARQIGRADLDRLVGLGFSVVMNGMPELLNFQRR